MCLARAAEVLGLPRERAELACGFGNRGPLCSGNSRVVSSEVRDNVLWGNGNGALQAHNNAERWLMIKDF